MNAKRTAFFGFGLLLILMLVACAPKTEAPPAVSQPAVAETAPGEPSTAMDTTAASAEIDINAFIKEKVAGNHDLDRIFNANKTREEWNTTLDRMIGYGAKINEQEKQMIIDYLLSR